MVDVARILALRTAVSQVDFIKSDISFTSAIKRHPRLSLIARSVTEMPNGLGRPSIAED
jgi:EAL domain-containing protein (putative c-di-GMP-specific phosphodiesterase class I)